MSCVSRGPDLPLKSFAGVDDIVVVSEGHSVVVCPSVRSTLAFEWSSVRHVNSFDGKC